MNLVHILRVSRIRVLKEKSYLISTFGQFDGGQFIVLCISLLDPSLVKYNKVPFGSCWDIQISGAELQVNSYLKNSLKKCMHFGVLSLFGCSGIRRSRVEGAVNRYIVGRSVNN